jgi:acyl-CoA reductase-like NAD-dependent aldehyde dehydrogenase
MAVAAEIQVRDKLYIGGEWVAPAGSETIEVVNAATEEVMGRIPQGTPADVDRAVAAARGAFEAWARTDLVERAELIRAIAAGLAARRDEIAATISQELGMPIVQSTGIQAGLPTMTFASVPDLLEDVAWREEVGNSVVVREPVGVVGAITPWNYPLHQIAAKVAPALAVGCTVVLKPSEVAPLNAFILAEIIDEVGLPPGVFNLVTGTGPVVGEAIASHPDVDMVSFTGSTRAGRRVSELASQSVKPVALELGGKSPNVILDDAELETAVTDGVAKCFLNSGQTCSALTRMLVPRNRLEEAERIAAAAADAYTVGDPFDEATRLGPLVSDVQRERVRGYIRKGVEEGARLVTGGEEPPAGKDRPGGDLRPRAVDHPLRRRGGRGPDCERLPVRARRRRLVGGRGARAARGPADPHGSGGDQRRRLQPARALWRLQAVRPRARAGQARAGGIPPGQVDAVLTPGKGSTTGRPRPGPAPPRRAGRPPAPRGGRAARSRPAASGSP